MKLGAELRSAIRAGHAREALRETLSLVALTEQEVRNPARHRRSLEEKLAVAREMDITEMWEAFHGSIRETCVDQQGWNERKAIIESAALKMKLRIPVMEQLAEDASATLGFKLEEAEVFSNAFSLLTQAKLYTTMMATYNLVDAVYQRLVGTFDSPFEVYDHQIPSEAPVLNYIAEGEQYPEAPISDKFCQTRAWKFGAIVSLTREVLITDRTGKVVETVEGLAKSAKYREDELAAKAWQDQSNATLVTDLAKADSAGSYFPERTNVPLYRTVAGVTKPGYEDAINKITSNDLAQWDNISNAMIKLRQMKNRNAQFIDVFGGGAMKVIVPFGIEQRANILTALGGAIQIGKGLADPAVGVESSFVRVPDGIRKMGVSSVEVITWSKLDTAGTATQSTWYLAGESTQQFKLHRRWDVEFSRATPAQLGGEDFNRDVLLKARAGFNSGVRSVDDKYVIQNKHA